MNLSQEISEVVQNRGSQRHKDRLRGSQVIRPENLGAVNHQIGRARPSGPTNEVQLRRGIEKTQEKELNLH